MPRSDLKRNPRASGVYVICIAVLLGMFAAIRFLAGSPMQAIAVALVAALFFVGGLRWATGPRRR
jgi:hypothetical protein